MRNGKSKMASTIPEKDRSSASKIDISLRLSSAAECSSSATTSNPPKLPLHFYCPLSKRLLTNPVVGPDGLSYEQNAVCQSLPEDDDEFSMEDLYPNRALKVIMEEAGVELSPLLPDDDDGDEPQDSTWANILRIQKSLEANLPKFWYPTKSLSSLPEAYFCPITMDLMHRPVIDPEGNTYEQSAIVDWIRTNGTSPISRAPLTVYDLYPNHVIRQLLEFHAKNCSQDAKEIHPALLQWKKERRAPSFYSAEIHSDDKHISTTAGMMLGIPMGNEMVFPEANRMDHSASPGGNRVPGNRNRRQQERLVIYAVVGILTLGLALVGAFQFGAVSSLFVAVLAVCWIRHFMVRLRHVQIDAEFRRQDHPSSGGSGVPDDSPEQDDPRRHPSSGLRRASNDEDRQQRLQRFQKRLLQLLQLQQETEKTAVQESGTVEVIPKS